MIQVLPHDGCSGQFKLVNGAGPIEAGREGDGHYIYFCQRCRKHMVVTVRLTESRETYGCDDPAK